MITLKKIGMMSATAAVLVVGSFSTGAFAAPVDAAKAPKFDVCHYQVEDELPLDEFGEPFIDEFGDTVIVDPAGWRVINISGNALPARHGDGAAMDFVIGNQTDADACTVLIDA